MKRLTPDAGAHREALARHLGFFNCHPYAAAGILTTSIIWAYERLLREKLWAYPASFAVFGAFIAYQLYRYTFTHGFGLIALTLFDLVVMLLIWHEYRLLKRHLPVE